MKKMNNKGMTIVELILTFAVLMVIVVGLLEVVLEAKQDVTDSNYVKQMEEYRTLVTKTIQDDLIKKKLTSVSISNPRSATFTFADGSRKGLNVTRGKLIRYDGISYDLPEKKYTEFRDSYLNPQSDSSKNSDVTISFDSTTKVLVIDIPIFKKTSSKNIPNESDHNYGIKIVHVIK